MCFKVDIEGIRAYIVGRIGKSTKDLNIGYLNSRISGKKRMQPFKGSGP